MPLAEFHHQFPRICTCLTEARRKQRIGQAYLMVGDDPDLLGRFTDAFVQTCLCTSPSKTGDACGACSNCLRLVAGSYPERYFVQPQSKSRQILIDDMRRLEHQLGLATTANAKKVGIIAEADCMGEEAQNAFLKTLEEPGPNTILMLYTTQPKHLLPTIRSRCQTLSLMTNKRSYENAANLGVFTCLAKLKPGAGAAVGLEVASRLEAVFAVLREQAEQWGENQRTHHWDSLAEEDTALQKRLSEEHAAKIEADYLRRRAGIEDAILTWSLQQLLEASGVPRDALPQKDMLGPETLAPNTQPLTIQEAERQIRLAEELIRCMDANVPEGLALDVFCLTVSEKEKPRKKSPLRA